MVPNTNTGTKSYQIKQGECPYQPVQPVPSEAALRQSFGLAVFLASNVLKTKYSDIGNVSFQAGQLIDGLTDIIVGLRQGEVMFVKHFQGAGKSNLILSDPYDLGLCPLANTIPSLLDWQRKKKRTCAHIYLL
jgi:hypothetical protein